jgi:hypothetical protein
MGGRRAHVTVGFLSRVDGRLRDYAAAQENSKFSWLRAPATNFSAFQTSRVTNMGQTRKPIQLPRSNRPSSGS